ncbi:ribosomal protein L4 [Metschnikowia bicuspidata]|uniref:Large ribosomal subunit protein uL4m n=1 Tax=Metschnikowia bicuspidata TaxID=27322 RepID=A0A4P9ZDJ0_9ASCO|nr:ribosomal protein L4 [Metschnikowia bicuspidata]
MFRQISRRISSSAFSVGTPAEFTLASIRTFPSLEPHTMKVYPRKFLDHPLRRDLLWSAVIYEADCARVGSGYVPTKADSPFSNRKLRPQKGTGRARVGDANSPTRDNGLKAHGIKAPHDWSTKLPLKVYSRAFRTALSDQYRNGRLYVIGGESAGEHEFTRADFAYAYPEQMRRFVEHHGLERLNLLFVVDGHREQLVSAAADMGKKCDVLVKECVEVRDILRANRIFVEESAMNWFVSRYVDMWPGI